MKMSQNSIREQIIIYFKKINYIESHCEDEACRYLATCKCIEQIGELAKGLSNNKHFDAEFAMQVRHSLVHCFKYKRTYRLVEQFLKRSKSQLYAIKLDIALNK